MLTLFHDVAVSTESCEDVKGSKMSKKRLPDLRTVFDAIVEDIGVAVKGIDKEVAETFRRAVLDARKLFLTGQGRSGSIARAATIRLAHLRKDVFRIGEIPNPPIGRRDLLVVCSCSGSTATALLHVKTAKKCGARIALVTARPNSALSREADIVVLIPDSQNTARQLGGLPFEQALMVFLDAICLLIAKEKGVSNAVMRKRHANLE